MGLDDIVAHELRPAPGRPGVSRLTTYKAAPEVPPPPLPHDPPLDDDGGAGGRAEGAARGLAQMDHTHETRHVRQHGQRGDRDQQQPQQRLRGRGGGMSLAERIQRWVCWAMKRGHSELRLAVDTSWSGSSAGWRVHLGELTETMRGARPEFGEFDARSLQAVLESTDDAGRFEFSGGHVRLVPRADRLPRQPSSSGVACNFSIATPREHRGRQAPSPPPWGGEKTEFWTPYKERESENVWWYYEGPRGEWWCHREGAQPLPYGEGRSAAAPEWL